MMNRWILPACVVMAVLGGCRGFVSPKLTSGQAVVETQTDDVARIVFDLELTNENRTPVPLREAEYAVRIDGEEVFRGIRSPERTLPTFSTAVIQLPASFDRGDLGSLEGREARLVGTIWYEQPGEFLSVLFETGIFRPSLAIDVPIVIGADGAMPR